MSTNFLTVNDYERQPSHHRSRSSGYIDDVEYGERRDRRERERQMKRYHDSKYHRYSASPTSPHQRSTSDYLGIPGFEAMIQKHHSTENITRDRDDLQRGYSLKEFRPSPSTYDTDLTNKPILSSRSVVPHARHTQRQKRPAITVEIHQNDPPPFNSPAGLTPRRSPSASPHSPTAQPQLQYQYATLQNRLAQIGSTCTTYAEVEAANPPDLTFAKIAEQVDGFAFDLHVWAQTVCLDGMAKIDSQKRHVVEATARNLDRLLFKAKELGDACARAKPRDLKFAGWPQFDEEKMFEEEGDDG
ncbi:hypothetical protein T440DRAFT_71936 [Plenodomus tracheiphilus IPT5]|uniref:Uncharacterized protein n=1 Tax=Plenodomus tracheiphilus IPT5 TaxID=1408161 RepID=A0A6A7BA25_9PLEO|nr:hypothetical protein T440DRAFT_71936 [Plenodomus tracheiphilus IPT5]